MTELAFRPAVALAAEIREKKISCRELLEHFLSRIERYNPELNAVVTLDSERARARASQADRELARGGLWGPLHGVPLTVKDTFETAGIKTTAGANIYSTHVPEQSALAVQRLVDAGAIVLGKTNTPAFASDLQTYNSLFGATKNPWDGGRTPGGSSGGSAAAVAAGLTSFELGSDIAGSIRVPAHFCGVYGHKPSYGIVPVAGHIPGPPATRSEADIMVVGPLARSVADLELCLDLAAGPPADRAVGWRLELPPPRKNRLAAYRAAVWLDDPAAPVDDDVKARLQQTVDALARAGVAVNDRARPGFELSKAFHHFLRLLWPVFAAGYPEHVFQGLVESAKTLPPSDESPRALFSRASTATHRDWLRANEARARYRASWAEFFREFDVLLCPVAPLPAIEHDHSADLIGRTIRVNGQDRWYWEQIAWPGLTGMSYLPATVAPCGRTDGGLPVGVQIVGAYLEDKTPLDFARRLADLQGGFEPPPLPG